MNMKKILTLFSVFILLLVSGCLEEKNKKQALSILVDDNYDKNTPGWGVNRFNDIQTAIDTAENNSVIHVNPGIYYGSILINKTIKIIGSGYQDTILDGSHSGDVISIAKEGQANITGFTIRNSGNPKYVYKNYAGIRILSDENEIVENNITNNDYGIFVLGTKHNTFKRNILYDNDDYGIYIDRGWTKGSKFNNVSQNVFSKNYYGLRIRGSTKNIVTQNAFINNSRGLYFCCGAYQNTIFKNNFINNTEWNAKDDLGNTWDNGTIGNYWSDFHNETQGAFDNDTNGIIDKAYQIPASAGGSKSEDRYPLVKPVEILAKT